MNLILSKTILKKKLVVVVYILIIFLITFLLNVLLNIYFKSSSEINNNILQKDSNRKIYVEIDDKKSEERKLNKILQNNKCEYISEYFLPITIYSNKLGLININKYTNEKLRIINGRMLDISNKNEIIIPNNIMIEEKKINPEELLNEEIEIPFNINNGDEKQKFLVVGIYENQSSNIQKNFYTHEKLVHSKNKMYIAIMKDANKTKKVLEELKQQHIKCSYYEESTQREFQVYKNIENIVMIFIVICTSLISVFIYYIVKNIIADQQKNISIMKVYGYTWHNILANLVICTMIIANISYIILLLLSLILYLITNTKELIIDNICSFIMTGVILNFISILSTINSFKKNKNKTIIKILNES